MDSSHYTSMTGSMRTILFNGDSFTYGDELDGYETNTHHSHTYAYKLSTELNSKYINLAQNGSSNTKIYRTTTKFLQQTNKKIDMIVIMWSNFGRFELCEPFTLQSDSEINIGRESDMNQIIANHHTDRFSFENRSNENPNRMRILKDYVNDVWTMQTSIVHTLMYMNNIQFLCDQMGISVIQSVIHGDMYKNFLSTLKSKDYDQYKLSVIESMSELRDECRIGLGRYSDIYNMSLNKNTIKPRGHACEDTHTDFANQLIDIIKEHNVSY